MRSNRTSTTDSYLGAGVRIRGELRQREGDLHIDGAIAGTVQADGRVEIGPAARVDGPVEAQEIAIAGAVHGSLSAQTSVHLAETAAVHGDVSSASFRVAEGARYRGSVRRTNPSPAAAPAPLANRAAGEALDPGEAPVSERPGTIDVEAGSERPATGSDADDLRGVTDGASPVSTRSGLSGDAPPNEAPAQSVDDDDSDIADDDSDIADDDSDIAGDGDGDADDGEDDFASGVQVDGDTAPPAASPSSPPRSGRAGRKHRRN